ncbi:hypothetical protein [Micromonospora zhanjiangensis]
MTGVIGEDQLDDDLILRGHRRLLPERDEQLPGLAAVDPTQFPRTAATGSRSHVPSSPGIGEHVVGAADFGATAKM